MGTGKVLLSGDGLILDFSVSFETLLEIPSVEIYGKLIGDFLQYENFEGKTSSVIYGDFLRFGVEEMIISRNGYIKSKSGDYLAKISTSKKEVGGRRIIMLEYVTTSATLIVPSNLPGGWTPIVKLALSIWKHERLLAIVLIIVLSFLSTIGLYFRFHYKNKPQLPTIKIYNTIPPF
jgi:hypothetical protein